MNEAKIYAGDRPIGNNTSIIPEFRINCEITQGEFDKAIVFMQKEGELATRKAFLKLLRYSLPCASCFLSWISSCFRLLEKGFCS